MVRNGNKSNLGNVCDGEQGLTLTDTKDIQCRGNECDRRVIK